MFKYLILAVIGVFLLIFSVFAQSSQNIIFTFTNEESLVNNVSLKVFFPAKILPVNLTPQMFWEPISRTLSVNLGQLLPNQKINISIDISGPSGVYQITSRLEGQWAQIGQPFQSELIIIEANLTTPASEIINLNTIAKNVGVPAAVTLAITAGGVLVTSAVTANASFATNIAEILRFIGFGFFRIRRPKPWGRVYNQLTKKPIGNASVKLIETTFQKLKGTQSTDDEGRFGFLVAPGNYYLAVSKRGFQKTKTNLITIAGSEKELNIEIGLISEASDKKKVGALKALGAFLKILNKINPWILAIGTLISFAITAILPTVFNFSIAGIYIVIDILKYLLSKKTLKSFGKVLDKNSNQPLALSVARIFDANKNWLLNSQVTDADGRFKFLVMPGDYYITCAKNGYESYTSQPVQITKAGLISWDIKLEKQA